MEKIKSFTIDHRTHKQGLYLSGVARGISTFDLRFKFPNKGEYLDIAAMHTIEHLFATVIRNSEVKDDVVYFGPMGCRTGFYLLMHDTDREKALPLIIKAFEDCLLLTEIPGNKEEECGNYKEHDLQKAKEEIKKYLLILKEGR